MAARLPLRLRAEDALLVYGITGLLAVAAGVFVACELSGVLAHARLPGISITQMAAALPHVLTRPASPAMWWPDPARNGVGPAWLVWPLLLGLAAAAVYGAGRAHRWYRGLGADPDGFATRAHVTRHLSEAALRHAAHQTRPSLRARTAALGELGYQLGRPVQPPAEGEQVLRAHWERMLRIIAPTGWGKTLRLLVPMIRRFPGPMLVATIKSDLIEWTLAARTARGPVAVLDPEGLALGAAPPVRWNPVPDCIDSRAAMDRAAAFVVGAIPLNRAQDSNSSFFQDSTIRVLACLLHAAALDGQDMRTVLAWSKKLDDDRPREILRRHPLAAPGWAQALHSHLSKAEETTSGVERTLELALGVFAHADALELVCPPEGEEFDFDDFITRRGTVYLIAKGDDNRGGGAAPLLTAFAERWLDRAEALGQRTKTRRLDPPAAFVADEAASIVPTPSLPRRAATSRSYGVWIAYALQSWAQERDRWGQSGSETLFDTVAVTLICGGLKNPKDLRAIEELVGKRKVTEINQSSSEHGGDSISTQRHWEPIQPGWKIRTLPDGQALMLFANLPPIITYLPGVWELPSHKQMEAQRLQVLAAVEAARTARQARLDRERAEGMARWQAMQAAKNDEGTW